MYEAVNKLKHLKAKKDADIVQMTKQVNKLRYLYWNAE